MQEITPYRERTLSANNMIPRNIRESQDRTIHRELIKKYRRLASILEPPQVLVKDSKTGG